VRHDTRKEMDMSMTPDRPEDAGKGALFKNDKKEKPSDLSPQNSSKNG